MNVARCHLWRCGELADAVASSLAQRADAVEIEQAVYGLDALEELELHPILHEAFRDAGFGVHPEQRYPRDRKKAKRSEGDRCDVVLTPDGRALAEPDAEATLFQPSDSVALGDAYWLEIKTVAQFTCEGANSCYASDLGRPLHADIAKLARDPEINYAGLLIVLFTSDEMVADHDLDIWCNRGRRRGLPIGHPWLRRSAIGDRFGNRLVTAALYPVEK